jgi:hypothetical protein
MSSYISASLRRAVIDRAGGCCEYCRVNTQYRAIDFAIDHIIAEKHGGSTTSDNLCLSCYWCNSYKGSDLASVDWLADGSIVPLFNPRQHYWNEHFLIVGSQIQPLTAQGRVTVYLLQMNTPERIEEREFMIMLGVFPCSSP